MFEQFYPWYNLPMRNQGFESSPIEPSGEDIQLQDNKEQERQKLYEGISLAIREMIPSYSKEQIIQTIKANGAAYEKADKELFSRLEELAKIKDDDEFVAQLSHRLRPMADVKIDQPELYESIQQQVILERPGYVKVNDLFAYESGKNDTYLQLHIFPVQERKDKLSLIKEGMQGLAQAVNENPNVQEVVAVAWIVASNPGLMKRLGFEIDAPMSEQELKEYFPNDKREIGKAHITREELLKRYLN